MKDKGLWGLALFLVAIIAPRLCFAEPYIAVREGLKCGVCHTNHTGGGKRTKMGTGVGAQDLPWKKIDLEAKKIPHFFWLREDLVSLGGDFRFNNHSTFVEDNAANSFETQEADLYLHVRLLPDRVSFYADESLAPGGVQSREIFGLMEGLPAYGWVKFGKIFVPYGLRLRDNTAFIRQVTGFNMDNADVGAELGFEPGSWSIAASFTNGTAGAADNNTGKLVVGSLTYVADSFRIGASGSFNPGPTGDRNSGAAFAGLHRGNAVLLGEVDYIHDGSVPDKDRNQVVLHSEVDYLIRSGWNIKAAYEFYDPDRNVAQNERDRFVIGVEPFITPFVQASVFYTFNQSIPQNKPQNGDELTFQLHLYF